MAHLLSSAFRKNVPEQYQDALMRLDDVALEGMLIQIIAGLPEDKLHEFEGALAYSDSGVLEAFLTNELPNIGTILTQTLERLEGNASELINTIES